MNDAKTHISYSELKNWLECGWRHKLVYIDKMSEFRPGIFSDFGTVIHDACENYLLTRTMDVDGALSKVREVWTERGYPSVPDWPEYKSAVPDLVYWTDTAKSILNDVPSFLDENFPGWEYVAAEERLMIPDDGIGVSFKGFIDGVIKTTSEKGKVTYHVIDWKTSGPDGWSREKSRDFKVHLQLMLYKIFWARTHDVPLKDVKCGFALLKRQNPDPSKRSKVLRTSYLPVSVGPKSVERALKSIRDMVFTMKSERFLKNRTSCKFCEFAGTQHCK